MGERRWWNEVPVLPGMGEFIREGGGAGDWDGHRGGGLWHTGAGLGLSLKADNKIPISIPDDNINGNISKL